MHTIGFIYNLTMADPRVRKVGGMKSVICHMVGQIYPRFRISYPKYGVSTFHQESVQFTPDYTASHSRTFVVSAVRT